MSRRFVSLALAAVILAAASSARAASITYTDRTSFLTAAGAVSTIDFEGVLAPGVGFEQIFPPDGFTRQGVNFNVGVAGGNSLLYVIEAGFYYSTAVLSFQQSPTPVDSLVVTLPAPTTAFGADFGAFEGNGWTFSLSNGDVLTGTAPALDGLAFFGVTSTTPFNSLVISSSNGVDNIDNVTVGAAVASASVPEPASLTLICTGIAAGLARGRRHGTRLDVDHRS